MNYFFANLASLVAEMKAKDWLIELFEFNFNGIEYFVFIKRYLENEHKPDYSLAKIIFLDKTNKERELILHANSRDFINLDVKTFREFFKIPYSEGGVGNAIKNFKEKFGQRIPITITPKNRNEKEIISNYIDNKRGTNKGIYLSHVKRLENKHRSSYTDHKAKLLRPEIYKHFQQDTRVTFCFFMDKEHENTDNKILELFARNNRI